MKKTEVKGWMIGLVVTAVLLWSAMIFGFGYMEHETAYDVERALIEYNGEVIEAKGKVTYNVPDSYFVDEDYCDSYFFIDGTKDYVVFICSVEDERIENDSLYLKVGDGFIKSDDGKVTRFW